MLAYFQTECLCKKGRAQIFDYRKSTVFFLRYNGKARPGEEHAAQSRPSSAAGTAEGTSHPHRKYSNSRRFEQCATLIQLPFVEKNLHEKELHCDAWMTERLKGFQRRTIEITTSLANVQWRIRATVVKSSFSSNRPRFRRPRSTGERKFT